MLFIIIAFKIKLCVSSQALSVEGDRKNGLAFSTAWGGEGRQGWGWGEGGTEKGSMKRHKNKIFSLYLLISIFL